MSRMFRYKKCMHDVKFKVMYVVTDECIGLVLRGGYAI